MSLVLGLDTSTEHVALALGRFGPGGVHVVGSRDFAAPRAALSELLPAVAELLEETGTDRTSIRTIVAGRGPGSFTGVRIGVATAKGLAHGLGARLIGAGTLDAVAWRFARRDCLLGVLGDAMRGEVYPALFTCGDGRCERLTADAVMRPEDAARAWLDLLGGPDAGSGADAPRRIVLTGNALAKYERIFAETLGEAAQVAEPESWAPTGEALLRAAHALGEAAGDGDPASLLPVYTRLSDAEEAERVRRPSSAGIVPPTGVAGPGGG